MSFTAEAYGLVGLRALYQSPPPLPLPLPARCIMVWIKSMGRQILQGNLNLVNTSFPVLMFEPRSYLQVRGASAARQLPTQPGSKQQLATVQ
jgi:hypothetical protein